MHYKNGTPAKIGDKIVGEDACGNPIAGVIIGAYAESDTCNLQVIPIVSSPFTMTAKECLRFDEALEVPDDSEDTPD